MEIIVRAVVMFGFLWLVTRLAGRATIGELSSFQLLLFVTMGDLVQQSVTQQDYSVTSGILAVSVFTLLTVMLSWANARFARVRPLTHGTPVVVVRDGQPCLEVMRRERLAPGDLRAAAREQGARHMGEVDLAVLETDGRISFFTRAEAESGAPERPPTG
ncbi:MAG: DUF421 domain-containing protein [Pseudonocardia sp.]